MEDPSTRIARAKKRIKEVVMGIATFTLLATSCTPKPNPQSKNNDTQKQSTEVLIKNTSGKAETVSPADAKTFQKAVTDLQKKKPITGSTVEKLAQITEEHGTQGSYEDELLASAKEDLQMGLASPTRLNELVEFVKENYNITNETGDDIIYSPESVIQDSKEKFPNSKKFGMLEIRGLELHLMKYPDGGAILDVGLADPVAGTYISSLSVVNKSEQSLAEMKNQCPDDLNAKIANSTLSIYMSVDSEGNVSTSGFDAKGLNTWQKQDGKVTEVTNDNPSTRVRGGTVVFDINSAMNNYYKNMGGL